MYFCINSSIGTQGVKVILTPSPRPVVYSTDCSKAVAMVLFLLFVALCSSVVPALLSVLFFVFSIFVVMLALWSPSSIAASFAFCFTKCVVMLAVGHLH